MKIMTELDIALRDTLSTFPRDYEKAKNLIKQGANINAVDEYGESIIQDCLFSFTDSLPECDNCDDPNCFNCEIRKKQSILELVDFFIENGWDTISHGLRAIGILVHTTHDKQMFYAAKRILEQPLSEDISMFEETLESIGTEESYQRCCEKCHDQENLYYAMYELVEARMNGENFSGIHPYHEVLGKQVHKIVYFADEIDFKETERGTEFSLDFGFVCGEDVVTVGPYVNILLKNDLINEKAQIDISEYFGEGIVGAFIVDVLFEHKSVYSGKSDHGQPTIVVRFDTGKEIRFTHNFGEIPDGELKARFITPDLQKRINDRIDGLVSLCDSTQIDLEKIESYILDAKITEDDVTRAALRLADKYIDEVDTFKSENGKNPESEELVTSSWPALFRLFLNYGLDTKSSFSSDRINHKNILLQLRFLDNKEIVYELFRLLFENGADPNIIIDDESFFEVIDGNVVMNATLFDIEGEDRISYEFEFRLWLIMIAYGGVTHGFRFPLKIKEGYHIDMFANCEAFSYRKEVTKNDWYLHIYITKTGEEVAVL